MKQREKEFLSFFALGALCTLILCLFIGAAKYRILVTSRSGVGQRVDLEAEKLWPLPRFQPWDPVHYVIDSTANSLEQREAMEGTSVFKSNKILNLPIEECMKSDNVGAQECDYVREKPEPEPETIRFKNHAWLPRK